MISLLMPWLVVRGVRGSTNCSMLRLIEEIINLAKDSRPGPLHQASRYSGPSFVEVRYLGRTFSVRETGALKLLKLSSRPASGRAERKTGTPA